LKALEDCKIEEQLSSLEAATGNKAADEAFDFRPMKESNI
jgi:hypothetical protein